MSNQLTLETAPADQELELMKRADLPAIWDEYRVKVEALKTTAETLVVKDASDVATMRLASETRKALKAVRCAVENRRLELVDGIKKEAKKIDSAAGAIWDQCEALEKRLKEQEDFAIRAEATRKQALAASRGEELSAYIANTAAYNLGEMSEDDYTSLRDGLKAAHEQKLAAAKKAEEERLAKEKAEAEARAAKAKEEAEERERIRQENERLREEAAAREAKMQAERAAADKARREAEAKARKEREALEAKARAEREAAEAERRKIEEAARIERQRIEAETRAREEKAAKERAAAEAKERQAREKIEAEARALREAEEKRQAALQAERRRVQREQAAAAKAPDKDKLRKFAAEIRAMKAPVLTSKEGAELADNLNNQLADFADWIDQQSTNL